MRHPTKKKSGSFAEKTGWCSDLRHAPARPLLLSFPSPVVSSHPTSRRSRSGFLSNCRRTSSTGTGQRQGLSRPRDDGAWARGTPRMQPALPRAAWWPPPAVSYLQLSSRTSGQGHYSRHRPPAVWPSPCHVPLHRWRRFPAARMVVIVCCWQLCT